MMRSSAEILSHFWRQKVSWKEKMKASSTPNPAEQKRIQAFCRELGITLRRIKRQLETHSGDETKTKKRGDLQ
jgi:cell wall assembly regulator SMI1